MAVLVTGYKGQLGQDVFRELSERNIECIGAGREDFDITDKKMVMKYVSALRPECVIHCAAYKDVDKAEDEPEKCFAANLDGTANIAEACSAVGTKLLYISTDYVFDGTKWGEYDIYDMPNPLGVYGKSKYEGEVVVRELLDRYFIVRTSWMFGKNGNNFIKRILKRADQSSVLEVVCDQIGSPTYTRDLAVLIVDMIKTEKYGTYHATNEGFCSWAEFAFEILRLCKRNNSVKPVCSDAYKTRAVRPSNSRLSKKSLDRAGFTRLPAWQDALLRYFNEE